tara:strand:+ start:1598 stop:2041 length:444 start_codon:yes stop_codon:yes gene_type:complete
MKKPAAPAAFVYRIARVLRVIDGDTIDVIFDLGFDVQLKQRIRMFGIDTPESRTRDKTEKKFGLASKKYLKDTVASADEIVCKTHVADARGKFGRVLGEIWCDGENINSKMIQEGYAVAYYGENKELVEKQHLKNRERLLKEGVVKL